jgi:hypothetical protein
VETTSAARPSKLTADREHTETPRSANCLNCGAPLSGPFCGQCGQRDVPPYPSVRELAVDAFWELSGWDGRFATTVKALFRRPGMLTREFLEGRRARYISPLRLYLMASLVYFVVAAAAPKLAETKAKNFAGIEGAGFKIGTTTTAPKTTAAQRVGDAASRSMQSANANPDIDPDSLTAEEQKEALDDIAKAPRIFQPFLRRAVVDPKGFKKGIFDAMPRMLFALLPIFAAIVAMFYHRRKYPEHLYFAIHLQAFVFLALALVQVSKFTQSAAIASYFGIAAAIWIPVYATIAFRRTYGGSVARTLLKEVGIGTIYGTVSTVAFLITIYVVAVFG